jgi:NAD(P)-dependent dehydrogenase (short-subunit alcohol dehydrogenase family)
MAVQDQLAVVTGASSGMGRETAKLLAQRGWHVLAGVRKAADGESLAADSIEPVILDITDQNQIDAVLARVGEDPARRPLSVLVNNAGISLNAPIETLPLADWRQQLLARRCRRVADRQRDRGRSGPSDSNQMR